MAATKYTYSITGDFPNQKVNLDSLTDEIEASSITTGLDYILVKQTQNTCDIWFVDTLSGGEETELDSVVAAHQGDPPSCVGCSSVLEVQFFS
jgi:hypothetical protein